MRRPISLLLGLLLAAAATAQQPKNQKKGFNANDVYQMNDIDTINAFNGNLILTIPIGNDYPVGGGLSYRLSLVSNGNVWEAEEMCRKPEGGPCETICPHLSACTELDLVQPTIMHPHRRANAGMGWQLTLGRLYSPNDPMMREDGRWTYESPDGADHPFPTEGEDTLSTTTDGSYLRMVVVNDTATPPDLMKQRRIIEFPNGEQRIFGPDDTDRRYWSLREIRNRFSGNFVTITYETVNPMAEHPGMKWVISDSHERTHEVEFEAMLHDSEYRLFVSQVRLANFAGRAAAEYNFTYADKTVNRGPAHTDDQATLGNTAQTTTVKVLAAVTLPDQRQFLFDYNPGSVLNYTGGLPTYMVLPTGGKITWEWLTYKKPAQSAASGEQYLAESTGVNRRRVFGPPDPVTGARPEIGVWKYDPGISCEPQLQFAENQCSLYTYFVNTFTDPAGTRTENYFSVAQTVGGLTTVPWSDLEYGQPIAKHLPDDSRTRWLSTRTYSSSGTLLRSTYLRMAHTGGMNFRPESSRVVYEDDILSGKPVYMDSDSSDWDGFGHYRQIRTSGTVPGTLSRVSRTEYVAPSTSWITGMFDAKSTEQGGNVLKSTYCWDGATGALTRQRVFAEIGSGGATPTMSARDLVTNYYYNADGNVIDETYRGGDQYPVGLESCQSVSTGTVTYRLFSTYSHGTLATNEYLDPNELDAFSFLNVDQTIDENTGRVRFSRDPSGIETEFDYDAMGRLTLVKPQGRAKTIYTYPAAAAPLQITAIQYPNAGGAPLTSKKYDLDVLGRVVREWTAIPGNLESRQEFVLDALGRMTSQTEPGTASSLPLTTFTYDALGRLTSTTVPDNSVFSISYVGDRLRTRTQKVATPLSLNATVSVAEQYDGYGQLIEVAEASGPTTSGSPNGSSVTTSYRYSPAGKLQSVRMKSGTAAQERTFDYDGRGLLRWESQPESGMASYTYDARGHVLDVDHGAAATEFDLRYAYDGKERLKRIDARNPFRTPQNNQPVFRPLKRFYYADDTVTKDVNNVEIPAGPLGTLYSATRYNWGSVMNPLTARDAHYAIMDVYKYDSLNRKTGKWISIDQVSGTLDIDGFPTSFGSAQNQIFTGVTLNELDLPTSTKYPMCLDCGAPSALDRSSMTRTYDRGRLTGITSFASSISYWPNGMRNTLVHANSIADVQVVGDMGRPSSISFGTYDRCVAPTLATQPASVTSSGGFVDLSVGALGTGPLRYDWIDTSTFANVGTSSTLHINPSTTTSYYVVVSNPCGTVQSQVAVVGVNTCPAPSTGTIRPVAQPDGAWVLTPDPTAGASATYQWSCLSGACPSPNNPINGVKTLRIAAVSITTTYRLTITDSCSTATGDVTITVDPVIGSSGLQASLVSSGGGQMQIKVQWPAVAGASGGYILERRAGTTWDEVTATSSTIVYDTVPSGLVYAYRVRLGKNYSNSDIVTNLTFTGASSGTAITPVPLNSTLDAVNAARAAAGWPAVTWQNILAATDPLPSPGALISARHVIACRARMTEVLQALGVPIASFTDADLTGVASQAVHVNEIQQRVHQ